MKFNQIVEMEAVRGKAIIKAVKRDGGTITPQMRKALNRLNVLLSQSQQGEVMDQSDAAMAVNLADSLSDGAANYANGLVWSFATRAADLLGTLAPLKVMLIGVALMIGAFLVPQHLNLASNVSLQIISVAIAAAFLTAHSVLCAGCVIGKEKAGVIREFLAFMFMLMPVFAVWTVIDDAGRADIGEHASLYRVMFVSFYFSQGVIAFLLAMAMSVKPQAQRQQNEPVFSPMGNDLFDSESSLLTDPNYSGANLDYVSDSTQI